MSAHNSHPTSTYIAPLDAAEGPLERALAQAC
jgi:hypothetical protein